MYASNATRARHLDLAFAALADPTRRAILARIAGGEATVTELAEPFHLAQPTVSKHLRVLEEAGFIEQTRDGQRRPRKLVPAAFSEVERWLGPFRAQWEARLDNLERLLATKAPGRSPNKRTR